VTSTGAIELTVAGVSTSVLAAGPTETDAAVVFVHGNPGTGRDWQPLIEPLSRFARCLAPTMPGYGAETDLHAFDYTVDGYASHLGVLLESLGARRVHLVTHDLGGIWGLAWAASHPDRLASLTLMSIGVLPDYRWHRYARLYRIPLIGELVLAAAGRSSVRRSLQAGSGHKVPDAFVDRVHRQYRNPVTRRAVLAFYRATEALGPVTLRAASAIATADMPTLVIWGAGDPYVPVRYAQVQQQFFPRAKVVVLPNTGHWPLVDDPDPVTEAVVAFLREQIA
jgi:pimeloyl-ACP methyl ester carboxylesterase